MSVISETDGFVGLENMKEHRCHVWMKWNSLYLFSPASDKCTMYLFWDKARNVKAVKLSSVLQLKSYSTMNQRLNSFLSHSVPTSAALQKFLMFIDKYLIYKMVKVSGFENSAMKSSFSLSSLRTAPAQPASAQCEALERPYHSLTKKRLVIF